MTGQHDRRVKFWAGQVNILAGYCPLTGEYFEPCILIISKIYCNSVALSYHHKISFNNKL